VRHVQWTRRTLGLVVLPLLLGGFLLMHGVDVSSDGGGHVAVAAAGAHPEPDHEEPHPHGGGCPDCWGHALAACVAVLAGLVTLRIVRRWAAALRSRPALVAAVRLVRERWELWHPPEPAWVHLSVMRC
jgi:hypothetical protein